MDTQIGQRLEAVARRLRTVQLGWCLAAIWAVAALVGFLLLRAVHIGQADSLAQTSGHKLFWWWMICSSALALLMSVALRFRQSNWMHIARRVEKQFPNLQQRLVTAGGNHPPNATGQVG